MCCHLCSHFVLHMYTHVMMYVLRFEAIFLGTLLPRLTQGSATMLALVHKGVQPCWPLSEPYFIVLVNLCKFRVFHILYNYIYDDICYKYALFVCVRYSTLAPDDIVRACSFRNRRGRYQRPVWKDPPGGQKYCPSHNVAPASHT